ncbi:hypothetical protein [Roseicitreum antarcticum]|uniref:Cation transport ATPase n=1 Tax=Roseicitreum antarcticum TaxID=564137 RepID=A0A1H2QQI1_9RHOB|nr:hypothetical protein [Roseicitreum antarcticum]SDW09447.1 hypothetical protein SAMN04488238_10178 [Roseicitreum antarcticum]
MAGRISVAALCAVAILSGCMDGTGAQTVAETRRTIAGVTITGPHGYCIDKAASNATFVLLGACDSLYGSAIAPRHYAILSAAVAEPDTDAPIPLADYATFFASDIGRAALSRDGDASTVTLLASDIRRDVLFLQISDTSQLNAGSLAAEYWRALLRVDGRIVTLNVLSPGADPLTAPEGQAKLAAFVVAINDANAD